jgi:hypothetical protein
VLPMRDAGPGRTCAGPQPTLGAAYADRMRNVIMCLSIGLLMVAVGDGRAEGAIIPSFYADGAAWGATHIVVADEGATIDGLFTVLESWLGALKPGTKLHVPAFAAFAPADMRTIYESFTPSKTLPPVTGRRMLLFLRHAGASEDPQAVATWKPASAWGGMEISACWCERTQCYGMIQTINPGPLRLVPLQTTEAELKARVHLVRGQKAALERIRTVKDPAERATQALRFVAADNGFATRAAFKILQGAGAPAIPHLLGLIGRDTVLPHEHQALTALGEMKDPRALPGLTRILGAELEFWRAKAPTLEAGWWNTTATRPLRGRYFRVYQGVVALGRLAAPSSEALLRKTQALWRGAAALHEIGSGQIDEICAEALKAIAAAQDASAKPASK